MSGTPRIVLVGMGDGALSRMDTLTSLNLELYCDIDEVGHGSEPAGDRPPTGRLDGAVPGHARVVRTIDLSRCPDDEIQGIVVGSDMTIVMALDPDVEERAIRVGEIASRAEVPFTLLATGRDTFDHGSVSRHFRGIIILDSDDIGGLLARILETFMYPSLINLDLADLRTVLGYGREALVSLMEFPRVGVPATGEAAGGGVPPAEGLTAIGGGSRHDAALVHIVGGSDLTVGQMDRICSDVVRRFGPRHMIMGVRIADDARCGATVLSIVTTERAN